MSRIISAVLLGAIIPVAAAFVGVNQALGAHPYWAMSTALIGVPFGLVWALILFRRIPRWFLILSLASITALGIAAAWYGKTQFAASYAEDVLAGRFWYYGWFLIPAGVAGLITAVLLPQNNP